MKNKKATIRDVAKEAGVSVATVSRFINNISYISPETEQKIKVVMKKLDYKPNEIARGLAKQKSKTIALIIPDISNPFFPELVVAIEEVAKLKGYSLILVNSNNDDLKNPKFWKEFQSRYIDGFVLASFEFNEEILKSLQKLQIPFVRVDRAVDTLTANSVGVDNYQGAVMAVEHLHELGCKKIAHISGPDVFIPSIDRLSGYRDTLQNYFPLQEPIVYQGDFTMESGKQLTQKLLEDHPDVDGIFLANDLMAIGSLKALKMLKIHVPTDIAIIGFDGIKIAEMVEPELSTIVQPIYRIGVAATNKLIHLIENTDDTEAYQLEVALAKRESTLGFVSKG
ncbi:LacI family transcriptional regulator [Bacillus sp. AFS001701]|uniref:LacI family DNA-binding transcriptional regulator n=1 Tax=Bacillus sp. AFS001701 TaxID=2033480 RepID=UPI000BF616AB|nr:LacI family DNA-binding transcriptional regulator [Bacillus sp. AFS001701]PET62859.1 LacI family transcriptional regulator [Bacillus sp. AFS001701]